MTEETNPDTVYAITDYYDYPRSGIANYRGNAHYFGRLFDESEDEFSSQYLLIPIDPVSITLSSGEWQLWSDCIAAFDKHNSVGTTCSVAREVKQKICKLSLEFHERLKCHPQRVIIADAEFQSATALAHASPEQIQVKWYNPLSV